MQDDESIAHCVIVTMHRNKMPLISVLLPACAALPARGAAALAVDEIDRYAEHGTRTVFMHIRLHRLIGRGL